VAAGEEVAVLLAVEAGATIVVGIVLVETAAVVVDAD